MTHLKAIFGYLGLVFLLCVCLGLSANAAQPAKPVSAPATITTQDAQMKAVQTMEEALLGSRFEQESLDARLSRIETLLFGQADSTKSIAVRLEKLQQVLNKGDLDPLAKKVVLPPLAQKPASSVTPAKTASKSVPVAPPNEQGTAKPAVKDATDYPTVTQMEQKLFGKTYVGETLEARLSRLDKHVYGMEQKTDLSGRVDNLRMLVLGDVPPPGLSQGPPIASSGAYSMPYGGGAPPSYIHIPPNNSLSNPGNNPMMTSGIPSPTDIPGMMPGQYPSTSMNPMGGVSYPYNGVAATPDQMAAMDEIEKQVLGTTYPADSLSNRLDRVETRVFNATAPEMTPDDRIQRVIAVASAGGAPQNPKQRAKSTMQVVLPFILTILPLLLL